MRVGDRKKYRLQLLTESLVFVSAGLLFVNFVILKRYSRFNIPIKITFTYLLTAVVDPFALGVSYYFTRKYEYHEKIK